MEKVRLKSKLSSAEQKEWDEIIRAGIKAQELIEGSIAVGGTASALYAKHRISRDTDHLLMSLKENFQRWIRPYDNHYEGTSQLFCQIYLF